MNAVSLFSGIGGADIAANWAGIDILAVSENDPFCCKVLNKNFPDTPNLGDIEKITKESFYAATGKHSADIVYGGFPCQPFSVAGQQKGKEDHRYLWDEMLRIIRIVSPSWVVGENVAGFIHLALDETLSDLEAEGYQTRTFVLPACAVNAKHRRDRVFIVAHSGSVRRQTYEGKSSEKQIPIQTPQQRHSRRNSISGRKRWVSEPRVPGMLDGHPTQLDKDRISALGNAIVPQVVYPLFEAIVRADAL